MTYQILLVDDEPIIRKGIISSIDWDENNVEFCGEASNGKEALELIPELQPDILITDIRMPIMDGLSLVKNVRSRFPRIKIVILSGYDDFEYAQKAIKSGVESYLLKPVGAQQLIEEIKIIIEKINSERERQQADERNNKLIREHYQSLKGSFFADLLRNKYTDHNYIISQASALQLNIDSVSWLALLLSIDDYLLWSEMESELDQESLRYLVLNIVEEVLQSVTPAFGAMGSLDQIIIFAGADSLNNIDENIDLALLKALKDIQKYVEKYLNCTVSIGIGQPVKNISMIKDSYQQALRAIRQKAYLGKATIISYQKDFDVDYLLPEYPSNMEHEIISQLRLGDAKLMADIIVKYFSELRQNRISLTNYRQNCLRLIYMSISGVEESGINIKSLDSEQKIIISRMEQLETADDFEKEIMIFLNKLLDLVLKSREDKYTGFVRITMDYVMEHYKEDISLSSLSKAIHITPNYLSKLFKKETGINFVDWLNQYRIEKAKELLIQFPDLKSYEIAEQVGFRDYKYFTYVFKKYARTTPKEFRN